MRRSLAGTSGMGRREDVHAPKHKVCVCCRDASAGTASSPGARPTRRAPYAGRMAAGGSGRLIHSPHTPVPQPVGAGGIGQKRPGVAAAPPASVCCRSRAIRRVRWVKSSARLHHQGRGGEAQGARAKASTNGRNPRTSRERPARPSLRHPTGRSSSPCGDGTPGL